MSDTTIINDLLAGDFGSSLADSKAEIKKLRTEIKQFTKAAADGMASTATAEVLVQTAFSDGIVYKIYMVPGAAVTANDTNYFTVNVYKYDAAGANKTIVGSINLKTTGGGGNGNMTAQVKYPFVLTNANIQVVANGTYTFEITKTGTGLICPASMFEIYSLQQ